MLSPLMVRTCPGTLLKMGTQPFAIVEITAGKKMAACCISLDAKMPMGVLEVHDWASGRVELCRQRVS